MARPLYDRGAAKPLRLDARPRRGGGIGRNRRPWGFVAAGLAALAVVGGVALAVRPSGAPPAATQTASRSAESVRKIQAVKTAEPPAAARPVAAAPAGVVAAAPPAPSVPEPSRMATATVPTEGPPTLLASIGPASDQPRPPASGDAPDARAAPDAMPGTPAAPASAPKGAVATTPTAPLDCVPGELRAVLADVAARFGAVSVVSTNRLNSDNHTPGTIRHTLHASCRAVDFKAGGNVNAVLAYLRTRPEVGGINSYRNGLIHIDLAGNFRAAALRPRTRPNVAVE